VTERLPYAPPVVAVESVEELEQRARQFLAPADATGPRGVWAGWISDLHHPDLMAYGAERILDAMAIAAAEGLDPEAAVREVCRRATEREAQKKREAEKDVREHKEGPDIYAPCPRCGTIGDSNFVVTTDPTGRYAVVCRRCQHPRPAQ
jgi:hypothetical protein